MVHLFCNFGHVQGKMAAEKEKSQYTPETFKVLLKKLVQTPNDFTPEDCAECFRHLCVQGASEAQVRVLRVGSCHVLSNTGRRFPDDFDAVWSGGIA